MDDVAEPYLITIEFKDGPPNQLVAWLTEREADLLESLLREDMTVRSATVKETWVVNRRELNTYLKDEFRISLRKRWVPTK